MAFFSTPQLKDRSSLQRAKQGLDLPERRMINASYRLDIIEFRTCRNVPVQAPSPDKVLRLAFYGGGVFGSSGIAATALLAYENWIIQRSSISKGSEERNLNGWGVLKMGMEENQS